jgi:triacylglycerol esterase/lipase EstA (alpha/beta hydrolase family)
MGIMAATSMSICIILLIILSTGTSSSFWLFHFANGIQPRSSIANKTPPLPVILIHGYYEDKSVWKDWQKLLQNKTKTFAVTFNTTNDECGSAADHAKELVQIIKQVKMKTGQDKVNIVGHSKGGLDARVYLADNITRNDVANLIMIGTPNAGSPIADLVVQEPLPFIEKIFGKSFASYWLCMPALLDLQTNSADNNAIQNPNTIYYTIAGNWTPSFSSQSCSEWPIDYPGWIYLGESANDGAVPIWSVESSKQPYFHNLLPVSSHCHQDLLGDEEFKLAEPIFLGKQ